MMRKLILTLLVLVAFRCTLALAADTVLTWPADGQNVMLRFTLGKLRQINSASGQADYLGEAQAENLTSKDIRAASFYLYLLDKNGKRVGEGYLEVTNLAAGQKARISVTAHAMSSFASMELKPQHLPSDEPMKIKTSLASVPSGATVRVDSVDSGTTPLILPIAPGKHVLEFIKEGYATESTPLEIAENAMPGSVNVELNPLAVDTVVLRDGTVLLGNVVSVTGSGVSVRIKGKASVLDRARVARVVFGGNRKSVSSSNKSRTSAATK